MPITLTRSLLVILIPGGVAVIPWLLIIAVIFEKDLAYYSKYASVFNIMGFALAVIVGKLFEGINTIIEKQWDKKLNEKYLVEKNWYDYLAFAYEQEPVGFRYISNKVTTMYFESAMMLASPIFILGVIGHVYTISNSFIIGLLVLLAVMSFIYFYWQAKRSHEVLCKTRVEINQRLRSFKNK